MKKIVCLFTKTVKQKQKSHSRVTKVNRFYDKFALCIYWGNISANTVVYIERH